MKSTRRRAAAAGVLLIFGLPTILAAVLISPTGVHDLVRGLSLAAIMISILLPFAAWQIFLGQFVLPPAGTGRIAALVKLSWGGTVMATAVLDLLAAAASYSPSRPGPAPTAGLLLAGLLLSMFISAGVWGAIAPVLSHDLAIRGTLVTGALLFVFVATLGFMIFG